MPLVQTHDVQAGLLLREWRRARRWSQLDLALSAGISARHLSYVETGKAQPSREMVGRLADALEMPLRERNALLVASGYAPQYPEHGLDAPQMARIRQAIDFILQQHEPYPAFVMNRHWDILLANDAAVRLNRHLLDGRDSPHRNMLRHFFDPGDLRARVDNWEEVAGELLRHLHALAASAPSDLKARALLDEVTAFPGVPSQWRRRELGSVPAPVLNVVFRHDGRTLGFFSTLTTFGTPRDITVDELHIECCFPADAATAAFCHALKEREPTAVACRSNGEALQAEPR
ncbi:helix-turn-helix domain-containing protein [Marilutibacter chinensis]|uniref:Helix-turn-helix transcriptional regulator n=1 Tax=Marilutibacter chinensis TaxID=2912247 RepID=A0ABS9HTM5_9GAMM|nr:helix-turn-helix transcriptional regulator [Lysobacter chinensis]MCF7222249.1 helix-turn-helix transcriptional regulator [Lysobacter chinensis]